MREKEKQKTADRKADQKQLSEQLNIKSGNNKMEVKI